MFCVNDTQVMEAWALDMKIAGSNMTFLGDPNGEVAKALDSRTAKLCCLAKDCDNAEYSNLVRALCDEGGVSLVMVDEGKQLGEWAGLCKINEEGEATSVVRCSAACVTEFGEDTRALSVLLTYLKAQAPEDK